MKGQGFVEHWYRATDGKMYRSIEEAVAVTIFRGLNAVGLREGLCAVDKVHASAIAELHALEYIHLDDRVTDAIHAHLGELPEIDGLAYRAP